MSQVTIDLPEPVLRRFRQGATAAHMALEAFVADRLATTPLPLSDDLPPDVRADLAPLERLDDAGLWRVAQEQLADAEQAQYDALLDDNARGALSAPDAELLRCIGDKARRLTLRRAHAFMILQWRGHVLPSEAGLRDPS
ncbi:MAG: hypothetical protein IT332_04990 [Ardenticatenales bacterium]|nr:hypothetical protein [Ardenticatenales bacterium]